MADGNNPTPFTSAADALRAARFEPIRRPVPPRTPRLIGSPGVRVSVRQRQRETAQLDFRFGEAAKTALGIVEGDTVAALIGEVDGRCAVWLRRAPRSEPCVMHVRRPHPNGAWQVVMGAWGLQLERQPPWDHAFETHPDGGIVIWPEGVYADAARKMAAHFAARA